MSDTKPESFTAWIDFYLDDCCASGQSLRTVRIKRCNLTLFVKWCLREEIASPAAVTKKVLETYKRYLNTYINPRTNNQLSAGTRKNRLTAVKTMFTQMVYLEVIATRLWKRLSTCPIDLAYCLGDKTASLHSIC